VNLASVTPSQTDKDSVSNFGAAFITASYSGSGNKVIELPKETQGSFFLVEADHPGEGIFEIDGLDNSDTPYFTILKKQGAYSGIRIGADTQKLKIVSETSWSIKIAAADSLKWLTSPTKGNTDEPFILPSSAKDIILQVDYAGKGDFALIQNGTVKLFEHSGPYKGSVTIPLAQDIRHDSSIIQIFAQGEWTIK